METRKDYLSRPQTVDSLNNSRNNHNNHNHNNLNNHNHNNLNNINNNNNNNKSFELRPFVRITTKNTFNNSESRPSTTDQIRKSAT